MQFSTVVIAASGLAAAGVAMAQSTFTVNTPASVVQCVPLQISWTGGQAPFNPFITAPGDTATILQALPQVNDRSTTWTVNIAAGQKFTINIVDSTGANAPSAQSPAIASGSSSCLGSSSSGSSSATSSGSSASSTGSSTAAATSSSSRSSSSSPSGSSSGTTSSTSAPASSSSTSHDGASSLSGFAAVIAGVVGIGAAALA